MKQGLLCFLYFSMLPFVAAGQSWQTGYTPLNSIYRDTGLLKKLDHKLEKDLGTPPASNREFIREIYTDRVETIKENIENEHYLFDTPINNYLDQILQEILIANPELPKSEINLFVSRYPSPNASCLGEGSIVFNIGLIRRLENEDQIAFVLCHELAHYMDHHVNNNIEKTGNSLASLEDNAKIKKIKKSKYNRQAQLEQLLSGLVYNNRLHSRMDESSADSLGMNFYLKTDYAPQEALNCILLLDQLDTDKYVGTPDIKKWFNFKEYPFKDRWLQERKVGLSKMKVNRDQALVDTLKTHPDCKIRYGLLSLQIKDQAISPTSKAKIDNETIDNIKSYADFEMIESYFRIENYGRCLFHALQLLEIYPENSYLRSKVGLSLVAIYEAQKNHQLNSYVDPIKNQQEDYKKVLLFIHNLRLSEIKKIAYYFLNRSASEFNQNEDYLFAYWQITKAMSLPEKADEIKKKYSKVFPKGKYADYFSE